MATYYVSAAGNDSNSGTSTGAPWLTVGKVNTVGLTAGDTCYFRGGDTFSGNLLIDPASAPTATSRLTVTSYGTGKATIAGGNSYGIKTLNAPYVTINYITVTGATVGVTGTYPNKTATTTSTEFPILITVTTAATWYSGLIIDEVDTVGGFGGCHLVNTNTSGTAAHENFRITRCNFTLTGIAGLMINGTGAGNYAHEHFGINYRYGYIADCTATDCYGITAYDWGYVAGGPIQTGFGFFILNCQDTVVERCFASRCGIASYNASPGGPVGIIFVECTRCTIRRCEASYIYASSGVDGEAFDFDGGCLNCTLEYCYGHNCEGPGMLIYQFGSHSTHSGSIVRYCIFEDCAQKCNTVFDQGSGTGTALVYHCTFFHTKNAAGPASIIDAADCTFRNNIFSVRSAGVFGVITTGALTGNVYHVGSGSTFSLTYNSVVYTSLALMQAASLEKIGTVAVGVSGDPLFINPGAAGVCLPTAQVPQLVNYDLGNSSPAQNAGVNLLQFSITPPVVDWHGNPSIANETSTLSGIDSGAVRKGSTVFVGFVGAR